MEPEFWHKKWDSGQIGFHEASVHPMLERHWSTLGIAAGGRVFAPLCGKSHDLLWLHQQGHEVVGVELSEIAVIDFFREHDLVSQRTAAGALVRYQAPGYELYCGDYFLLNAEQLGSVDAVYDRAALIALPPPMRNAYAAHLNTLTTAATRMLLITVAYDQSQISPPPFVVEDNEVQLHYQRDWSCAKLSTAAADVKGHVATESAFYLQRKTSHG